MKIIEPGHIYQLQHLDGSGAGILTFVNREAGTEHEGTQTQEVLRALIDRTQHCDACERWDGNDKIIEHLRMALTLHEARALERKTAKGELQPEKVVTSADGHFTLDACMVNPLSSRVCSRGTKSCVLAHANDVKVQYPPMAPPKRDERFAPKMPIDDKKPDRDPMLDAVTSRNLGEPKTTDYCKQCGESPESATHTLRPGNTRHNYVDPRVTKASYNSAYVPVDPRANNAAFLPGSFGPGCTYVGPSVAWTTTYGTVPAPSTWRCNTPMCGESGVCDECKKRGAR